MKAVLMSVLMSSVVPATVFGAGNGVHRIAVDMTVKRCGLFGCSVERATWTASAVAIGRLNGREYLITAEHLFKGGTRGNGIIQTQTVHAITIETADAGNFAAVYHGGRDYKGTKGIDIALISVASERRWNFSPLMKRQLPLSGQNVSIVGYPAGHYVDRKSKIRQYLSKWGVECSGIAKSGESGGAILYGGRLAGVVWGSRIGDCWGTFGTPAGQISKFVVERLGTMPAGKSVEVRPKHYQRSTVGPRLPDTARQTQQSIEVLTSRIDALQGVVLPVRIETSDGVVVRSKRLKLTRKAGRLEFEPIVLRFDKTLLTGGQHGGGN